jgi:hypothetical protein
VTPLGVCRFSGVWAMGRAKGADRIRCLTGKVADDILGEICRGN